MSSELIERLRDEYARNGRQGAYAWQARELCGKAAATIAQLQAELAEARNQALEEAAQEVEKWFPANSATKYPTGGIAAAIRAMKS